LRVTTKVGRSKLTAHLSCALDSPAMALPSLLAASSPVLPASSAAAPSPQLQPITAVQAPGAAHGAMKSKKRRSCPCGTKLSGYASSIGEEEVCSRCYLRHTEACSSCARKQLPSQQPFVLLSPLLLDCHGLYHLLCYQHRQEVPMLLATHEPVLQLIELEGRTTLFPQLQQIRLWEMRLSTCCWRCRTRRRLC